VTVDQRRTPDRPPGLADRRVVERLLAELPDAGSIPRDDGELAFDAPWELRALGIAVVAHREGHFPWSDFQQELIEAIQQWEAAPSAQRDDWHYYRHWVRALERLVSERGLADAGEIDSRTHEYLSGQRDPKHR
jgi:nitrile hydratase accessory protein